MKSKTTIETLAKTFNISTDEVINILIALYANNMNFRKNEVKNDISELEPYRALIEKL